MSQEIRRHRELVGKTMFPHLTRTDIITMCAVGLAGEVGEVTEPIKKALFHPGKSLTDIDREKLSAELGDVIWYVHALAIQFDLDLEQILQQNADKLVKRHGIS